MMNKELNEYAYNSECAYKSTLPNYIILQFNFNTNNYLWYNNRC